MAADLPRPRPAVRATVQRSDLSAAASTKVSKALACSRSKGGMLGPARGGGLVQCGVTTGALPAPGRPS
eukprot:scaffold60091_cov28-Tisochrysis_lutea.AAC.2